MKYHQEEGPPEVLEDVHKGYPQASRHSEARLWVEAVHIRREELER